jgi:hypothetical protein
MGSRSTTQFYPVVFLKDLLEELIMRGVAFPLTEDLDFIMDDMDVYGRTKRYEWYCEVVEYLTIILKQGYSAPKKFIVRDCIEFEMEVLLNSRLVYNSLYVPDILRQWKENFDQFYHDSHTFKE